MCATATLVPAQAQAVTSCSVRWGSLPKVVNATPLREGTALGTARVGHHACYDRLVFDVPGAVGTVTVGYVGTGSASPMVLGVVARHRTTGSGVIDAPLRPTGLPTIIGTSDAEQWTVADHARVAVVRSRLPFRVFTVKGPGSTNRVVVDVAHRW